MYPHRAQQISEIILISGGGPTPLAPPAKNDELPPFSCIYNVLHPLFYCGLKRYDIITKILTFFKYNFLVNFA